MTNAFVADLTEDLRREPLDLDQLAAALDERVARARAAWATLDVSDLAFARWLAQRIPPTGGGVVSALLSLQTDALYLTCACAAGSRGALAAFERTFFGEIDPTLVRITRSRELSSEVAQRLRERLFLPTEDGKARIAGYGGRGDLRGWVRATVARIVLNLVSPKIREAAVDDAILAALPATGPNPELALLRESYRVEFKAALRAVIDALTPRDRTILAHAFVDGLNIDEIGAIYGVHRATAARWIEKIRERVVKGIETELRERLGQSERALHDFESGFDVSIERYLAGDSGRAGE